jgi:hypothetical protein
MRSILTISAALALAFTTSTVVPAYAAAQDSARVVLDGRFVEWEGVAPVLTDPADGRAPYADVLSVQARADVDAGYLALTLREPVALQALPAPLLLLVDFDGPMGGEVHGMRGVDAVLEFSGGSGAGVWLRTISPEGTPDSLVSANAAELMMAPSYASSRVELRFRRGGPLNIGGQIRFRFVALDSAGAVVDATDAFTADFSGVRLPPLEPGGGLADPLARAPGTDLRVVSWNVGREDLFQQPDAFSALLRPLAPDLLLLDEVAGGHSVREVEAVLNRILPGELAWRAVYGVSGGSQRGVIAARGAAPRLLPPFDQPIPYPDSTRALVPADVPDAAAWLQSRLDARVPATGALVEIGGRRIFAVTVDLESGGAPGSVRDRLRVIEAHAIRDAAQAAFMARTPDGVDAILLAGDLNLVGTRAPLDVLAAPAGDGPAFAIAEPLRLDGASATTWENPAEPFTPGRLDFFLHHPEMTVVTGGFVFRAGDLAPRWLERHGLTAEASSVTDHLPIITDLRFVRPAR